MSNAEERIERLERRFRDAVITIAVLGTSLFIFAGYTWHDIPSKVKAALHDHSIRKAKEQAEKYAEMARAASETADLSMERASHAASAAENEVERAKAAAEKVAEVENSRITALESRFSRRVLWGVNANNNIYWSRDNGQSWHKTNGKLKQIAAGDGIVWGVSDRDRIYWSKDDGKTWNQVKGELKQISAWP